jgi:hypothetical protein
MQFFILLWFGIGFIFYMDGVNPLGLAFGGICLLCALGTEL